MLLMLVAGREAARELSVFQITELRSLIGFCMFYPLVRAHGGFRAMATMRLPQHLGRNAVHYGAQYLWFLALTLIPVAQVVSIESTMPIWTAILAALFLGERITVRKSLAIVLGVIGVVIIVRPGVGESNVGQLIMLIAAVGFGISIVLMKSLTRTDPVVVIIFWMLVIQSAIGFGPALYTWTWPSAHVWPWVVVVAFCGTFSHYCMTNAMRYADATIVVPMDFLRVPLSAAVGWLVYAERLDLYTIIGAAIILAGNMLNLTSGTPARAKAAA
ncbi:DMT family transporter [Bradyrhizobium prioriisuperbiae]|uniref:DMT family transporter n=1 Tax=Bradyrhizobium prioriisuperbiae TaxID=2854389 RepID=UPI0028F16780|nr:DMT family transporter [Bradyrhizobium prioritasuperba]